MVAEMKFFNKSPGATPKNGTARCPGEDARLFLRNLFYLCCNSNPRNLRTHILRLLGPKTCFDAQGKGNLVTALKEVVATIPKTW